MILFALSLFFARPAPLDMPRAEAFLVREDGRARLEDRFNPLDLWVSGAVVGRWSDDDGRVFTLSTLNFEPPPVEADVPVTRMAFAETQTAIERKDERRRRAAIEVLSPCPIADEGRSPRQLPRGCAAVDYWQEPTNLTTIVCAFRAEKADCWRLAVWELVEGDNIYERMHELEGKFLALRGGSDATPSVKALFDATDKAQRPKAKAFRAALTERELLRRDARQSVAAYAVWHVTDAPEFVVLDALPTNSRIVTAITNELPTLRRSYAETIPTPLDGSNVLCVARIYADRDDYLDAVGEEMAWSAAYWCPERRELVAHLPEAGEDQLLRTFRHEAFHQYLSYATSMIVASPWFNEGYAQYFEDSASTDWGKDFVLTPELISRYAQALPGIFQMDYADFYAGTDVERRLKYRLAWSVAVFLEKGAPQVRFRPFENLKRDYVSSLLKTQDRRAATAAAFGSADKLRLFVAEWKKFWQK